VVKRFVLTPARDELRHRGHAEPSAPPADGGKGHARPGRGRRRRGQRRGFPRRDRRAGRETKLLSLREARREDQRAAPLGRTVKVETDDQFVALGVECNPLDESWGQIVNLGEQPRCVALRTARARSAPPRCAEAGSTLAKRPRSEINGAVVCSVDFAERRPKAGVEAAEHTGTMEIPEQPFFVPRWRSDQRWRSRAVQINAMAKPSQELLAEAVAARCH